MTATTGRPMPKLAFRLSSREDGIPVCEVKVAWPIEPTCDLPGVSGLRVTRQSLAGDEAGFGALLALRDALRHAQHRERQLPRATPRHSRELTQRIVDLLDEAAWLREPATAGERVAS